MNTKFYFNAEMPETNPAYLTPEFKAYLDEVAERVSEEDAYESVVNDWIESQSCTANEMPETNPAYCTPEFKAYLDEVAERVSGEDAYDSLVEDWIESQK